MRDNIEIRSPSEQEIRSFYGGIIIREIIEIYGAFLSGRCVAMAGLIRDPSYFGTIFEEDGRIIGFLDVSDNVSGLNFASIRAMKSRLAELKYPVYIKCDSVNHQSAIKLLKLLGFKETDELGTDFRNKNTLRIWEWRR